jgi:anti-sigma factor ChrR (cupin superfamily)
MLDTAALPADEIPAGRAALIKQRVLARIAPGIESKESAQFAEVLRDDGWKTFLPKAEMKVVFDDGVTMSWLIRLAPGGSLPPHSHDDGPEECVMIEGELEVNGVRYHAGDYSVALQGSKHDVVRTDTGALFYLRSPSPKARSARV